MAEISTASTAQPENQKPLEPTPPTSANVAVPDTDEKFFAAVAYLGPLFLVTLIVKPKSAFCKFHAKQSMVLLLVVFIIFAVLFSVPWIGSLLTLGIFAVYVLSMYRAYNGELWNIPVVSTFAGKMNIEAMYGKAGLAVSSIPGLKETAETLAKKAGEAAKALGSQEEDKKQQPPALPSEPSVSIPSSPQGQNTPPNNQ